MSKAWDSRCRGFRLWQLLGLGFSRILGLGLSSFRVFGSRRFGLQVKIHAGGSQPTSGLSVNLAKGWH